MCRSGKPALTVLKSLARGEPDDLVIMSAKAGANRADKILVRAFARRQASAPT